VNEDSFDNLQRIAVKIVERVSPQDVFVVRDGFSSLAADWNRASSQNEGRFIGGPEIATFAAIVVPFLVGFLGDIAKDVAKDEIKKDITALLEKLLDRHTNADETARLRSEIEAAISSSGFSNAQKDTLRFGFIQLFSKLSAAS
jgi:hypothetical protein